MCIFPNENQSEYEPPNREMSHEKVLESVYPIIQNIEWTKKKL